MRPPMTPSFDLRVAPIDRVIPHEEVEDGRVERRVHEQPVGGEPGDEPIDPAVFHLLVGDDAVDGGDPQVEGGGHQPAHRIGGNPNGTRDPTARMRG